MVFTGFHGSVIKLQGQNSEVLRILIYTRLKINKKISLWTSFLPRSLFPFENRAIWTSSFSQCETPILNRIAVALRKSREKVSSLDFQQSTVKPRGASLQRIPGTKVLAWDQARSDQAPHWGKKGEKKSAWADKKRLMKAADSWVCYFSFHPVFAFFPQCGAWSQAAKVPPATRRLLFCLHIHISLACPHRAFQSQCYSCNNFKHKNLKSRKIID